MASLASSGTNTTARMPVRFAAQALAAPWLPVEAVTTPSAPPARNASSAGSAPRHLNAPSSCTSSRFRNSGLPSASAGGASSSGVGRSVIREILPGTGRSTETGRTCFSNGWGISVPLFETRMTHPERAGLWPPITGVVGWLLVRAITPDAGEVRAEGRVHRGRRVATAEGFVRRASDGKLLTHGTSTCMILAAGGAG